MDRRIRDVLMRRSRFALDIIMSILLVLQMLYLLVGEMYHEWAGLALVVLFIAHNVLNRRWYKVILKGRYTKKRILSTVINSACVISIIALAVSGISMARHSFDVQLLSMGKARILHMTAAYWGFVFISLHAGLHITATLRKAAGRHYGKIAIVIISIIGIWAFLKERFLYYMFLIEEFVFFDFSTPLVLMIVEYMLIMCLLMLAGSALGLMASMRHCKKKQRDSPTTDTEIPVR